MARSCQKEKTAEGMEGGGAQGTAQRVRYRNPPPMAALAFHASATDSAC